MVLTLTPQAQSRAGRWSMIEGARPIPGRRQAALAAACAVFAVGTAVAAQPTQGPRPYASVAAAPVAPPAIDPLTVALRPEQAAVLRQALTDADSHGFDPGEFVPANLDALLASRDPQAQKQGQALLIVSVLRYAKQVHAGQLGDDGFENDWGLRPPAYDPGPDFVRAAQQDGLAQWLASLPPPYTGYDTLRQGLATYRQIAARGGWQPISDGPPLKLGSTGSRVAELRARLAAEDSMVDAAGADTFDQPLAQAVMRAQKRFGLQDDGVVSGQTLAALNTPLQERIDQIVANLERWRWLPPVLPVDRIQVNIAAAILTVFHADGPVLSMRAVTGRPGDETPMLQSRVESIVFNPPWNVPSSIATKELWPKERANPGYFAAHDFMVVPTGDGGTRLVQRAGNQAALGKIKFDFPNKYGVYLHDTPSRSTFDRFARLASHGCVRLQKPLELARALMSGDSTWTPEVIDQTLADGKTVRAPLSQPIAVFLLYWTAYVGPDGMVNFRNDPYGWDHDLIARIRGGATAAPAPPARQTGT
ncbi:MAG: L,D-transpeptidase family protein [Phenylobacterium sp.]